MECTLIQKLEPATLLICKSFPLCLNWCSVRRRSWTRPEQCNLWIYLQTTCLIDATTTLWLHFSKSLKEGEVIFVISPKPPSFKRFQYHLIKATNHDWRTHQLYSLTLQLLSTNSSCGHKWKRFWLLVSSKSSQQSPLLTIFLLLCKSWSRS